MSKFGFFYHGFLQTWISKSRFSIPVDYVEFLYDNKKNSSLTLSSNNSTAPCNRLHEKSFEVIYYTKVGPSWLLKNPVHVALGRFNDGPCVLIMISTPFEIRHHPPNTQVGSKNKSCLMINIMIFLSHCTSICLEKLK